MNEALAKVAPTYARQFQELEELKNKYNKLFISYEIMKGLVTRQAKRIQEAELENERLREIAQREQEEKGQYCKALTLLEEYTWLPELSGFALLAIEVKLEPVQVCLTVYAEEAEMKMAEGKGEGITEALFNLGKTIEREFREITEESDMTWA